MENENYNVFFEALQDTLRDLYNPVTLRQNKLLLLLDLTNRSNPVMSLQEHIIDAIQALRPADNVPIQADSWRIYHVLNYRHIEQSSQPTVAATLSLSVRHLRRLERLSEQALADYLWKRYHVQEKMEKLRHSAQPFAVQGTSQENPPDVNDELDWLKVSFPNQTDDIAHLVNTVLETVKPLFTQSHILIRCEIDPGIPPIHGQLVAFRQALLNLLTAAAHAINSGTVALNVTPERSGIRIDIHTPASEWKPWTTSDSVADHVQMARRFAKLFNGMLEIGAVQLKSPPFNAVLHYPLDEAVPVLVIDDNEDILRLIQRYLTGTLYRFVGVRNPDEALNLVKELSPRAVLMDVMLPGNNDWDLLGQLRVHPALLGVPIIVCTILPQEDLALALGAAAYLRKPINREVLLSTLDQIVHRSSKVS